MILGATFSHRHLQYLKLDINDSLRSLLNLKFDLVRLGIYWDESEPEPGKFDFSHIKKLLDLCEKNEQDVVLTIGMKAPRWPEFYLPQFLKYKKPNELENEILNFIEKSVKEVSGYNCIKYFQVENEPMDPSGPKKLVIPFEVLKKEVDLIHSLDKRPITINLWGNQLSKRNLYSKAMIADIVGLDIYYKTPFLRSYNGPKDSDMKIKEIMSSLNKPFWITELQTEPWERNELVALSDNPPSINASLLKENYNRAREMNPAAILLWGFEYWLYRKKKGDSRLWDAVLEIDR